MWFCDCKDLSNIIHEALVIYLCVDRGSGVVCRFIVAHKSVPLKLVTYLVCVIIYKLSVTRFMTPSFVGCNKIFISSLRILSAGAQLALKPIQ